MCNKMVYPTLIYIICRILRQFFFCFLIFLHSFTPVLWQHDSRHFGLSGCTHAGWLATRTVLECCSLWSTYRHADRPDALYKCIFYWHLSADLCMTLAWTTVFLSLLMRSIWSMSYLHCLLSKLCCVYIYIYTFRYSGYCHKYVHWLKNDWTKPSPPDAGWALWGFSCSGIPKRFRFSFQCCVICTQWSEATFV